MKKTLTMHTLVVAMLLTVIITLIYSNHQLSSQNHRLVTHVENLNQQLNRIDRSTHKVVERIAAIEQKLQPQYQDLLSLNK